MSTDPSTALLLDCRRSASSAQLIQYNAPAVSALTRQISALHSHLVAQLQATHDPTPPAPVMFASTNHHLNIRRLKRVLLVYHAHRLNTLRGMLHRAHLSYTHILPSIRPLLSPSELTFLRAYAHIAMDYRAQFIDVVDIAASVDTPPKDLWVSVKVVKEVGKVITDGGVVDFQKGGRYLVRRADVEMLLVQGFLEVVD